MTGDVREGKLTMTSIFDFLYPAFCDCGMIRLGNTFYRWTKRCCAHPDGRHDPKVSR